MPTEEAINVFYLLVCRPLAFGAELDTRQVIDYPTPYTSKHKYDQKLFKHALLQQLTVHNQIIPAKSNSETQVNPT